MFQLAVSYTIFDMATSNLNKISIYNKKKLSPLLLASLIGHNNPFNGFQPLATHPSRRLCFLGAYTSWSHQSKAGLPQLGPSNEYKYVRFVDFRRSSHQIYVSPEHPPAYERHGRASAAAGY